MFFTGGLRERGRDSDKKVEVVRFVTHSIQNIRNGGIESALHGMDQANVDLGILQGAKITGGIHTRESTEFCVIVSDGPSRHYRGMSLFYKYLTHFVVEDHHQHGPNITRFQLVPGRRCWHVVGC